MLQNFLDRGATGKWHPPGEQMIKRAAKAVYVGANVRLPAVASLFRRNIVRRAHQRSRQGNQGFCRSFAFPKDPRQAKVENLYDALRRRWRIGMEHQVMGLQVAMDHAAVMCMLQTKSRLPNTVARLGDGEWSTPGQPLGQSFPLDIFHYKEVRVAGLIGVEGRDNVRMR